MRRLLLELFAAFGPAPLARQAIGELREFGPREVEKP